MLDNLRHGGQDEVSLVADKISFHLLRLHPAASVAGRRGGHAFWQSGPPGHPGFLDHFRDTAGSVVLPDAPTEPTGLRDNRIHGRLRVTLFNDARHHPPQSNRHDIRDANGPRSYVFRDDLFYGSGARQHRRRTQIGLDHSKALERAISKIIGR